MTRWSYLVACLGLLSGCAGVHRGTYLTPAQLAGFQDGRTTVTEVTAQLGAPSTDVSESEMRVLGYVWTDIAAGPFQAVRGGQQTVSFVFGPDGVLLRHRVAESRYGG